MARWRLGGLAAAMMAMGGIAATIAPAAAVQPPTGIWITEHDRGAIEIFPCGGGNLCGRLVRIDESKPPPGAKGPPIDIHNPDPKLRDRPLCGLVILHDFAPDGQSGGFEGEIYNPEDGQTYNARIALESPSILKVRGYVLISLLGQTQEWRRATDSFTERCSPLPPLTPAR